MMEFLTQSTWADRIGWVLIHSLWQFAIVALLAMVLQLVLRRCSATVRYRALLVVLFLMAAMPVATWFLTSSTERVLVAEVPQAEKEPRPVELEPRPVEEADPISLESPQDESLAPVVVPVESPRELAIGPPVERKSRYLEPEVQELESASTGFSFSLSSIQNHIERWLPEIVLLWCAGVLVAAFRPLLSWYMVHRLRTAGVSQVGDAIQKMLERTAKRLGIVRTVGVLQSRLVKTPVVVGYFRPVILLPLGVVTGLSAMQLELILAHELAHVRRHDYLINLFQTLVETFFFYHPALWWVSRQIRNERENCCDDVAMSTVGSRADYGRALLAIVELCAKPTPLSLAARGGLLLNRIQRIAGCEPTPRFVGSGSILSVVLITTAIFVVAAWGAAEEKSSLDLETKDTTTAEKVLSEEVTFEGLVTDEAGKPIVGATIRHLKKDSKPNAPKIEAKTDKTGHFRLASICDVSEENDFHPPATVLTVQARGYAPKMFELSHSKLSVPMKISLREGQAVQGRVVDRAGQPIQGVSVKLTYWHGRSRQFGIETTTDAEGKFHLEDAPRDDYTEYDFAKEGYLISTHFMIPSSKETVVTLRPPLRVIGTIVDAETNQPLKKCTVTRGLDYYADWSPEWQEKKVIDGHYRFDRIRRQRIFRIQIESEGYIPLISSPIDPAKIDGRELTYNVKLIKIGLIKGTVLDVDGKSVADAEVCLTPRSLYFNADRDRFFNALNERITVTTDENGRFTFSSEVNKPFYLMVNAKWDYVNVNAKDFADDFTVYLNASQAEVQSYLEKNQADKKAKPEAKTASDKGKAWQPGQVLDFQVVDAVTKKPVPGVKLELQYHGRGINFQDVKIQTTDEEGRSEIKLPDRRPDAVRVYPSKPGYVPIRIYWGDDLRSPKLPKSVTVPLEPGTVWGGVVKNEKGEPIPDVKVNVHYWGHGKEFNPHRRANIDVETTTDKDGRWQLDVMPSKFDEEGPWVYLTHPDYLSDHLQRGYIPRPITERPSYESLTKQTAVMVMTKGVTVEGQVTDKAGKPIAGATVRHQQECYGPDSPKQETKTDETGHFRLTRLRDVSEVSRPYENATLLTVHAPGYSPEMVEASLSKTALPLNVSLEPGQPVHGRVVDVKGKPIKGVSIKLDLWKRLRRFYFKTTTDADGRFRLEDAPQGHTEYDFEKNGYMAVRKPMSPSSEDYVITLRTPLKISGTIVDAETNEPLKKGKIIRGIDYQDGRAPQWMRRFMEKKISKGRYQFTLTQKQTASRFRVEADGYMPAVSPIFDPNKIDKDRVTYDFKLKKAEPITGTVLDAEGTPLADAEVILATQATRVKDGKASDTQWGNNRSTRTDANGQFTFPPEAEPFYLVVLAKKGRAIVDEKQFAKLPVARIEPWTTENRNFEVERRPHTHSENSLRDATKPSTLIRVVDVDGKPVEGALVGRSASFQGWSDRIRPQESRWTFYSDGMSDRDGIARIPGENRIDCLVARHAEKKLVGIAEIPFGSQKTDDISITMYPECRVFGKLTSKALEDHGRKLERTNVYLCLEKGIGRPLSYSSRNADFDLCVPPGTYRLDAYGNGTKSAWKTITVEPGQKELEVETIDLPPKRIILLEGQLAPELRDVVAWKNGGPIKLADLKGKVVILSFGHRWTQTHSWLPTVLPVYEKYHDQGLEIVEVRIATEYEVNSKNLDEKVAEVKKPFRKVGDYPIPIALVREKRSSDSQEGAFVNHLEEDYGINSLTCNVLIDRQGRIVGEFYPSSKPAMEALEKALKEK